eukprot:COSAG01_NODE_7915_length_2994_cov_16.350604_4_plen_73_part_00
MQGQVVVRHHLGALALRVAGRLQVLSCRPARPDRDVAVLNVLLGSPLLRAATVPSQQNSLTESCWQESTSHV